MLTGEGNVATQWISGDRYMVGNDVGTRQGDQRMPWKREPQMSTACDAMPCYAMHDIRSSAGARQHMSLIIN